MIRKVFLPAIAAVLVVASLGSGHAAPAASKSIELPLDGIQLKPSSLPGYAKAQAICAACHSAEYMQYQPATAARAYWEAMTRRMKVVFNAPVSDEDIPLIVDYLAKTYGNEQPK